jgi:putative tricarboxylic transport membrane protein
MTNVALGLTAFLIAGLYTLGILNIPLLGFGDPLGPRLLPSFLAGAMALIGVALIVEGRSLSGIREDWARFRSYLSGQDFRVVAAATVWTGLYFVAFGPLGYLLSTALFLLGMIGLFHRGSKITGAVVSVLFAAISYALFAGIFAVPLPRGILPF